VHQDGLVHVSQLADHFVSDPNAVLKVGQRVQVSVVDVDMERNRIALSMKTKPELDSRPSAGGQRGAASRSASPGSNRPTGRAPSPSLSGGWFDMAVARKKG
jgi:uncharacterized protein